MFLRQPRGLSGGLCWESGGQKKRKAGRAGKTQNTAEVSGRQEGQRVGRKEDSNMISGNEKHREVAGE